MNVVGRGASVEVDGVWVVERKEIDAVAGGCVSETVSWIVGG